MAKRDIVAELNRINQELARKHKTSDQHYIAAQQRVNNPKAQANLKQAVKTKRDNSYQAETNSRPEVRKAISLALAGVPKTLEHKQALRATKTNKPGNAHWEEATQAGRNKRDRPFYSEEYGVFPNRSSAARYAASQGLPNAIKRFEQYKGTTGPNRFITHEEYAEILKRKDK